MSRASKLLRKSGRVLLSRDGDLLQALQTELRHELSSTPSSSNHLREYLHDNKVGEFTLEWDNAQAKDLVLRRKCGSGEEIVVSALLGPLLYDGDNLLPRDALMKICVVKPDFDPVLQFDCAVFSQENEGSHFDILNANYLPSPCSLLGHSSYRSPIFRNQDENRKQETAVVEDRARRNLDTALQEDFKDYLVSRGINVELTDFLLQYLHKKEQIQYVDWLRKLETLIKKDV